MVKYYNTLSNLLICLNKPLRLRYNEQYELFVLYSEELMHTNGQVSS